MGRGPTSIAPGACARVRSVRRRVAAGAGRAMYDETPTTEQAHARTGDARTLHAFQVFFAVHCLGFLGMLWARDASPSVRALFESLGLPAGMSAAPAAPWQLLSYAFVHELPLEVVVSL